ncbi:hypothetical protein IMCC1989_1911 [gamma proteobacterium IMCC1989]|nr:hypothetical protein IMCC1989_1911 [gamma proteobacterium IMCC1989]
MSSHIEGEFGHPYSGTESAISSAPCMLAVSGTALFLPAPFVIADIPLSFMLDTLFLPWDLTTEAEGERADVVFTSKECMDGMSGDKHALKDSTPTEDNK